MRTIKLTNSSRVVTVDDGDFKELSGYPWHLGANGYPMRAYWLPDEGRSARVQMGRHILGLDRGDPRKADHINRDPFDNRRANLRIVNHAQSAQNRHHPPGASAYRGVALNRRADKWQVKITVNGKGYYLGLFDDEHEAGQLAKDFYRTHVPMAGIR